MPTRERVLRQEARAGAARRGHELGQFRIPVIAAGAYAHGREAVCKRCGRAVGVYPGYSYEIMGEAVALNCIGEGTSRSASSALLSEEGT